MKIPTTFVLLVLICSSVYAQKQSTPQFEFTYNCTQTSKDFNFKRNSWSYEYEDKTDEIFITIDVKINPRGEDYPKQLIDGLVMNDGVVKTVISTFQKKYAAVSTGETQGYYLRKATFNSNHKMYIVSVIGNNKELIVKVYKQLEETFVTK